MHKNILRLDREKSHGRLKRHSSLVVVGLFVLAPLLSACIPKPITGEKSIPTPAGLEDRSTSLGGLGDWLGYCQEETFRLNGQEAEVIEKERIAAFLELCGHEYEVLIEDGLVLVRKIGQ
ncbi:hypothetical protein HY612_05420 [Candidatus Roizmanbacteria bacterium]|nr:hypothetical protein [Candidatus Roizmanbacteria bacterium]